MILSALIHENLLYNSLFRWPIHDILVSFFLPYIFRKFAYKSSSIDIIGKDHSCYYPFTCFPTHFSTDGIKRIQCIVQAAKISFIRIMQIVR